MQDQDARSNRVVQLRPGDLDLLQLAQAVRAESINGALVARLCRVYSKLAVQEPPSETVAGASK